MSWLSSFFLAVLTSAVAAAAGGFVANTCVDWYRISPREGGAGYFVVYIGLLSCVFGFFAGLILSRYFGGPGFAGFFKGLGVSAGALLGLAAVVAAGAWMLADIPPTIDGHTLDLIVEIRLPKDAAQPTADPEGRQSLYMTSSNTPNQAYRAYQYGSLDLAKAKLVEGRWIVPGTVPIFTTRGSRSLTISLGGKQEVIGFVLPFPGHPGREFEKWSEWLPRGTAAEPWPETKISYRFRVQQDIPIEAAPVPDIDQQIAALPADAPLVEWLNFLTNGRDAARDRAVMKAVEARPADLAKLLRASDFSQFNLATNAASLLKTADPEVVQALRDVAVDIEIQLRKFNTATPQQEGYFDQANDIRNRFKAWSIAWGNICQVGKVDGKPLLEEFVALAGVQANSGHMQEVVGDAQRQLYLLAHPELVSHP